MITLFVLTIWHYAPPVVRAITKFKFCQKVIKRDKKKKKKKTSFLTYFFSRKSEKAHGCRYTLVVCGLQIDVSQTVFSCSSLAH